MFFSKKKKKEEEESAPEDSDDPNAEPEVPVAPPQASSGSSDLSVGMLTADVEKLKAQFGTFYELQKTTTERFSRINEQIGELRSMMIERDKTGQHIEAKATQAIDLVKTVQPDRLMIELRKNDGKIEALRANLESTENIINNVVSELKEIKNKMNIYRGMEQVVRLNEEAKKELMDVKKIQAIVERHGDKVETIFSEMQKKFSDFAKFNDTVKDLDKSFKQMSSEFDSFRIKMSDFSTKKEAENLITKFDDFEKYTGNVIKLINNKFDALQKEIKDDLNKKFEDADKLLKGFEMLARKTPDLDKYFNLLSEEGKKVAHANAEVEPLKEAGQSEEQSKPEAPEKTGVMEKMTKFFKKEEK